MTKLKYIIWNPFLGRATFANGGWVAIYTLFENMKNLGEEVYLAFEVEQHLPGLRDYEEGDFFSLGGYPNLENFRQLDLNECATIYPEAAFSLRMDGAIGNPTSSKYVVRWLLHRPDYHLGHGSETWGEKDLLFAMYNWVKAESEEIGFKVEDQLLKTLHIDYDIFKDRNGLRQGTCHIVKKGGEGEKDQLPLGSVDISDIASRGDPYLLSDAFNQYENFYSYDCKSWLSLLAALCGCNSIIACRPEPKENFYKGRPNYWKYGIAYGVGDVGRAKKTNHLLKSELIKEQDDCLSSVKSFINHTKIKF